MSDWDDLKRAAAETNRALDAYVMSRAAGDDRTAVLRGDLNAAFYRQYDVDRRHTPDAQEEDNR